MRGPWLRQHDPDLLANGNILLFDNQGQCRPGGITRVIEVDPRTQEIVWTYAGTPEEPFESEVRSSEARLPNGNTLITESDGGRLFEVTRPRRDRLELRQPGARASADDGQTGDPDRLLGRAYRPCIVGTRGAVTAAGIGHDLAGSAQRLIADRCKPDLAASRCNLTWLSPLGPLPWRL